MTIEIKYPPTPPDPAVELLRGEWGALHASIGGIPAKLLVELGSIEIAFFWPKYMTLSWSVRL